MMLNIKLIIVNIAEQRLYCLDNLKRPICDYPISTSSYGVGNMDGSFKTPLGEHSIAQKIGEGCPRDEVFIGRQAQGVLEDLMSSGKTLPDDIITSRILRLKGCISGLNKGHDSDGNNIDSYLRYIYIHGTSEENKIGTAASHGCIRMRNQDVIELFDQVSEGCKVEIKEK